MANPESDPTDLRDRPTPEGPPLPPLAGAGRRLAARLVDLVILFFGTSALTGLIWGFGRDPLTAADRTVADTLLPALLQIAVAVVYEGLMLTRRGQTVGKLVLGIRVTRLADGTVPSGAPGWLRAAVLYVPGLVPLVGLLLVLVNVVWQLWDTPYRQCLHDKAAKTVVVRTS